MRIPNFEIRSERSVRYAACEAVPNLMVIAGPNGSGKSTLLNAICSRGGWNNIMYVGPHRGMRRQQVQQRYLLASEISISKLLMSPSISSYEGIRIIDSQRDPWSYDDSANYLKYALCQIELDRQQAIANRFDKDGEIPRDTLLDPWKPLRELTHHLLPHLQFSKIDASNRNQVLCQWLVHDTGTLVDLDDLSSGEKSIVQMFYPLVERQIKGILAQIQYGSSADLQEELAILIDEPELHLHPNLQLKVLDYLRLLSSNESMQVMVATHSPTIVEYSSFEELFLLRPPELVASGENQLVRIATDEDRLRLLRESFGGTSNITAMQPILVVEGGSSSESGRTVPDRKLYRALHSGFDGVTLISGGGKGECKALVKALNDLLPQFSTKLRATALLDRDIGPGANGQEIILLPVAMIENFLLDPDSVWESVQSVIERTEWRSVDDIRDALDKLLTSSESEEIDRRLINQFGVAYFRPSKPANSIPQQVSEFVAEITEKYSTAALEKERGSAIAQVEQLKSERRRREEFHGKSILNKLFTTYLHNTGLSKVVFTFETARHARRRRSVTSFFDDLFQKTLG